MERNGVLVEEVREDVELIEDILADLVMVDQVN